MNIAKRLLLSTYLQATAPLRSLSRRRRQARQAEPVQILFYHRVADEHPNPWTIGCQAFADQIDWLVDRFDLVSLAEAQRRIVAGQNDRPTVVISFDDGYADNCDFALPLLLDRELPFAYFVTTGNVIDGRPFPHDQQRGVPLAPNSVADVQALAEAGVEVGAHTRTHVDLATVDSQRLREEIVGSKHDLESITGQPVQYFAFPYGQPQHMTPEGFLVARDAGFAGVCSAYGGYNFPGGDPFHLERIHADPEFLRFQHWLSVDHLKQWSSPTYQPERTLLDQPSGASPAMIGVGK